jgi:hypothetical protein
LPIIREISSQPVTTAIEPSPGDMVLGQLAPWFTYILLQQKPGPVTFGEARHGSTEKAVNGIKSNYGKPAREISSLDK